MSDNSPGVDISSRVREWLTHFGTAGEPFGSAPLDGQFALTAEATEPDLYGMLDAVYVLHTLGCLEELTNVASREHWASRILECQDESGWFTRKNRRGHSREHATAYAVGALALLQLSAPEDYVGRVKPVEAFRPLLTDQQAAIRWLTHLGFYTWRDLLHKDVGWHHVWRGSHVGGGVAAAIGMLAAPIRAWWGDGVDVDGWFQWYLDWLDAECSPRTGLWQRAFYNILLRRATVIDLGGAAHFHWIYQARLRSMPHPARVIDSVLSLQQPSGLYKERPLCIDLDAMNSLIRCYLQLPADQQTPCKVDVTTCVQRNYEAVINCLLHDDLQVVYPDSHGLPGALICLTETTKLPGFRSQTELAGWQHVLDSVWWL